MILSTDINIRMVKLGYSDRVQKKLLLNELNIHSDMSDRALFFITLLPSVWAILTIMLTFENERSVVGGYLPILRRTLKIRVIHS